MFGVGCSPVATPRPDVPAPLIAPSEPVAVSPTESALPLTSPLVVEPPVTALPSAQAVGIGASEDWPDWRGPNENRHAPSSMGLIDSFDPETGTNVLWKK